MAKIDSWLDDYIEKFYNDKALRNKILTMSMKGRKEADELLATNCPHYQKKKMKETLANYAEKLIRRRRNRIRQKHVATLLRNTDRKLDPRSKTQFLESGIETAILWYRSEMIQLQDT